MKGKLLSHAILFATPCTVAHKAPLSMGFLRQEYQSGLPFPSPRDLSNSGMEPMSSASVGGFFTAESPGKPVSMKSGLRTGFGLVLGGRRKWQPTPAFLPGESQGWRSLVCCRLWGPTELDTTEVT